MQRADAGSSSSSHAAEVLRRMGLPEARPPAETLDRIFPRATELDGFRPIAEGLEWRIAQSFWSTAGVAPFVEGEVPYVVNNNGTLSGNAAALLFAELSEHPGGTSSIHVLELGAGTGLFARYFLDAFRNLCAAHGRDFYDRLILVVSDYSGRSVAQWKERGVFSGHEAHVVAVEGDAGRPQQLMSLACPGKIARPRAVLCNYLLDVLPATVVRNRGDEIEELYVRSHLPVDDDFLRQHTSLSREDARALAASREPEAFLKLAALWPSSSWRPASYQLARRSRPSPEKPRSADERS